MKVTISIRCDNAAFGETDEERAAEVASLLGIIAARIRLEGIDDGPVLDANGNRVGSVTVS